MISEKQLIREYKFLWKKWLPHLNNQYFKRITYNKTEGIAFRKWIDNLQTKVPSKYNDLIAEISFNCFASSILEKSKKNTIDEILDKDIEGALDKMQIIRGGRFDRSKITDEMLNDVIILSNRLFAFFIEPSNEILINPKLLGFGKLASCHPDVFTKTSIIEIKSSKDSFRIEDIRQVILYAFLAYCNEMNFEKLILLNPRRGEQITFEKNSFCKIFSGKTFSSLVYEIRQDLL